MFTRAAGIAGVVVLLSACGGPATSPLVLWWDTDEFWRPIGGIRTGMPLDSLEQFWIEHDGLRESANVWDRCVPADAGAKRCTRETARPPGRFDMVASADGRVVYLAFAPATRDIVFDLALTRMQGAWIRKRGARLDPHGVSDEHPYGVAEMRVGRWRAFNTFDGKRVREHGSPPPLPQFDPARRLARRPTVRGHVRAAVSRGRASRSRQAGAQHDAPLLILTPPQKS